jgi:hypothetical protein
MLPSMQIRPGPQITTEVGSVRRPPEEVVHALVENGSKYALYVPLVAGAVMLKVRDWLLMFETSAISAQPLVPPVVGLVEIRQLIEPARFAAFPLLLETLMLALIVAPEATLSISLPSSVALVREAAART